MLSEFRMPALGADMEEGTVAKWNVAPGSRVKRGDVVAVVETDKGAIDIEIFEDGVLREIVVQPGVKVPVGAVLALVEREGEPATLAAPRGIGRPGRELGRAAVARRSSDPQDELLDREVAGVRRTLERIASELDAQ